MLKYCLSILKKNALVGVLLLFVVSCKIPDKSAGESSQRVLVVVEKGTNSVGFYTEKGNHIQSVKVDTFPHEMVFSVDKKYAYVTNNGSLRFTDEVEGGSTVSIIDLQKMEGAGAIYLHPYRRPHGIFIDNESGLMALTVENPDKVLLIDTQKKVILKEFDSNGDTPHMVTLSRGAKQLFVSNVQGSTVAIIDAGTGNSKLIDVGEKPQGSACIENRNVLFVGCKDHIAVVDIGNYSVIDKIPIGSNRMALINNDSLLLASTSSYPEDYGVAFINTADCKLDYHLELPYKPFSLQVSVDGKYIYVAAEEQDVVYTISIIDKKNYRAI